MRLALISYQKGHLKTRQLAMRFLALGHQVMILAFPFKTKNVEETSMKRFQDRPFQILDMDVKRFCLDYGIDYVEVAGWNEECCNAVNDLGYQIDYFFTCTAKIIPPHFLRNKVIINAHPGILPQNRGVDAFKRSIINELPIGVTLHIIDEAIDRGVLLKRFAVPICKEDSLKDVAERVYEFEIVLMTNFENYLSNAGRGARVGDEYPISHSKISEKDDSEIELIFERKKETLIEKSRELTICSPKCIRCNDIKQGSGENE